MKTLLVRALSALVGVALIGLLIHFAGLNGMRFLGLLVVLLGTREGVRILFPDVAKSPLGLIFAALTAGLFVYGVYNFDFVGPAYALVFVLFFSISLFFQKQFADLEQLSRFQSRSILGFFYLSLLPTFAIKLLDFDNGLIWFIGLLAFVFAGDTFAYLVGSKFGRRRLMPAISPKKSLEGSLGGLLGSAIAAILLHPFVSYVPLPTLVGLALMVGLTGQMGDLFESLLKRVANQKDSGSLMPGHGGVLDRVDGILFAAPVMFAGVSLLENGF